MLALLGWFAQLCLPLAHASVMAERGLGIASWCGAGSTTLEAKLAELPVEIRDILKDSVKHGVHASDSCATLCVTPLAAAVPVQSPILALRAAGLEALPVESPLPAWAGPRPTPPARGPPA